MSTRNISEKLDENDNTIGFSVSISFSKSGSTDISLKIRSKPGTPLETTFIKDASKGQLYAVCDILDNL